MKNIWRLIAICLAIALAVSIGTRAASAAAKPTVVADCGPRQPNMSAAIASMKSAIQNLKDAQGSLKNAEKNKGGWRITAMNSTNASIRSINTAITQVNIGCNMAD